MGNNLCAILVTQETTQRIIEKETLGWHMDWERHVAESLCNFQLL